MVQGISSGLPGETGEGGGRLHPIHPSVSDQKRKVVAAQRTLAHHVNCDALGHYFSLRVMDYLHTRKGVATQGLVQVLVSPSVPESVLLLRTRQIQGTGE